MKAIISRFLTKNEATSETPDKHHAYQSFIFYFIEKSASTPTQRELQAYGENYNFPDEAYIAAFHLVQLYLKVEDYLLGKDPRYTGSKAILRSEIQAHFPEFASTDAFLPLFEEAKNQEIVLGHHFLKFVIYSLVKETDSKQLESRWFGVQNTNALSKTSSNEVERIHETRRIKEKSREIYADLAKSFGNDWIELTFNKAITEYHAFYTQLRTIKFIQDLAPTKSNSEVKLEVDKSHVEIKPFVFETTTTVDVKKHAILENILEGFVLINAHGRIIDCNSRALSIFDVTKQKLKNSLLFDYLPKKIALSLRQDIQKEDPGVANLIVGKRNEVVLHGRNGSIGDFEITITNNYTIEADTYSVFLKNITHKIDVLKSIQEAKLNAERTANAKSTFLSNMSHEIRTPLNVILGLSEIIKKNAQMDEALLRKNLDGIDFSAQNLLSIVNDILDFSKIEAGKLSIQAIDFNVRKVITSLTDGFEIKAIESGLNLITRIDQNIPDVVIGDQYRLNQILTNLIGNAIKFTQEGGITVSVTAKDVIEEEVHIHFKVEDTGIGIPADNLANIFDSFYQVETPDSSKMTGTGLGLAITKQLISLQNGKLQATSEVGKGSVFEFTLPFRKSKLLRIAEGDTTYVKEGKKLDGLKVLVAEDNKMNQFYIKQLLKNLNVEVDIAENGQEAIDIFKQPRSNYDLILMDMHMPIMNGIEAISEIRKSNKNAIKKVPIVACSADVFPEARKNAIKAGIDFYLTKPLNEDALKEVLFWLISDEDLKSKTSTLPAAMLPKEEAQGTHVDINQLNETFDNDEEFIISLLEVFIKDTPEDYKSLRNCMEREYYSRVSALAHKMKSSFMNLGMTVPGHHLQVIESQIIKREGLAEAKRHIDLFSKLYTKALLEINILLIEYRRK